MRGHRELEQAAVGTGVPTTGVKRHWRPAWVTKQSASVGIRPGDFSLPVRWRSAQAGRRMNCREPASIPAARNRQGDLVNKHVAMLPLKCSSRRADCVPQ